MSQVKPRRANVTETVKMSLLCEVQGTCPICRNQLVVKKDKKQVRVFDVAHIYPLNATKHELDILKDEELLSDDIDCDDNFIALCKICHKIYDTQKTVDEYRQLVTIKKNIIKLKELSETWDKQVLHTDITQIVDTIGSFDSNNIKDTELSLNALKLSDKKDDSLGIIYEIKVSSYILNFFTPIHESFKKLEMEGRASSSFIYSQVRSYYVLLVTKGFDQSVIFEKMCEWFMKSTAINDLDKAEVLVSFFIQNCEVYSNVNT